MSSYFLLRGRSALLREIMAAWISLTAGAILFGVVYARFFPAGEGTAFIAAAVLAIPVSYLLLQMIRAGLPAQAIPQGVTTLQSENMSRWKVGESRRFAGFWASLDAKEKEELQWLTGMMAGSVPGNPSPLASDQARSSLELDDSDITDWKGRIKEEGREEFLVRVKDRTDCFVVVQLDRKKREMHLTLRDKGLLGE